MSVNITMPALSPTMEEGNLAKWLVKEGDAISAGDVIAEIETDKATMEVEAVDEGVLAKIVVAEGSEGVKVNAVIAVLAEDGEDVASVTVAEPVAAQSSPEVEPALVAPVVKEPTAPVVTASVKPDDDKSDRVFASPLARRIAEQKGLDLSTLKGSGPRGRIVKADVEGAVPMAASAPKSTIAPSMSDEAVLQLYEEGAYESLPHDGMRKVIAERLTESAQTIPSYFITMECQIDALLALRAQMNAAAPQDDDGKPAYKISVNDFLVKAMALALQTVPMANVSWTSSARIFHKHSDVGVAVAVEDGLFTPIVRKAEGKSLSTISAEVKDMASRARNKRLAPAEYQGGSTAVSNLGMFGVKEFTSIINPPHASIVSVGAGEKKPVVKDGELAVATLMSATFAFDHRAIDGALGAQLAAAFKRFVEQPAGMLA